MKNTLFNTLGLILQSPYGVAFLSNRKETYLVVAIMKADISANGSNKVVTSHYLLAGGDCDFPLRKSLDKFGDGHG